MTSRLTHFAINADDVEATQAFYGAVFGWKFQSYGPPGFVQIMDEAGQAPIGAIQQRRELVPGQPTLGFECTFGVDDVDAAREQIVEAGGKILMERFTIPNVGHLIAFQDPGGNPALAMQYDSSAEETDRLHSGPVDGLNRTTGITLEESRKGPDPVCD